MTEEGQVTSLATSSEVVDTIVSKLRHVTRTRSLEHAIEVGQIVAEGVMRSNVPHGHGEPHPLYMRVATHQDLPFSPKRLWMCVKIYELVRAFPHLRETSHLGIAHLRAVLALPPPVQERLLNRAENERWTSARVESKAAALRRRPGNRGRPPRKHLFQMIERIQHLAENVRETLAARMTRHLTPGSVLVAIETLRRATRSLEALAREMACATQAQAGTNSAGSPAHLDVDS